MFHDFLTNVTYTACREAYFSL